MVKRAIITKDQFRISAPSVDVDSAQDHQFVLHEAYLSAQPYWTQWVPCPFAGAGSGFSEATVPVPPPPVVLPNTTLLMYSQGSTQNNYYPSAIAPSQAFDSWSVRLRGDMTTKTSMSVYFFKDGNATAPRGVWVIYMRSFIS